MSERPIELVNAVAGPSKRPCDVCRKRKIKCLPPESSKDGQTSGQKRCRGCENLDVRCSFDYVNKKPGRPLGSTSSGTVAEMKRARSSSNKTQPQDKATCQSTQLAPRPLTPPFREPMRENTELSPGVHPQLPSIRTNMLVSPVNAYTDHVGQRLQDQARPEDYERDIVWPRIAAESTPYGFSPDPFVGAGYAPQFEDEDRPLATTIRDGEQGDDARYRGTKRRSDASPADSFTKSRPAPSVMSPYQGIRPDPELGDGWMRRSASIGYLGSPPDLQGPSHSGSGPPTYPGQYQPPERPLAHRQSFTSTHSASSVQRPYIAEPHQNQSLNPPDPSYGLSSSVYRRSAKGPMLEDVVPYAQISFFISLYLQHQHALVPTVHRPTFSYDLVRRRDQKDSEFRALLLSLVAYVICQVPKSKMADYSQSQLETLQSKCFLASRQLQDEVAEDRARVNGQPTLNTVNILIADYFSCQASGDLTAAATTLGHAARLSYVMRLHEGDRARDPDEEEPFDHVEKELRRRVFWQLYNTDKTDACSGLPIMMHDFEGIPPFPLCIDDEFLIRDGPPPKIQDTRPDQKPSYMVGFVALARLFQVMGECQLLTRQGTTCLQNPILSLEWIARALNKVEDILESLPLMLRPSAPLDPEMDVDSTFAVQRANLLITAVSVKFELLNFKAIADPTYDITSERDEVGRKMYDLLSRTPLENLAANGEAMRGKVLRIIIALLGTSETTFWNQDVKKWWDMYSRVQFVQVIPINPNELVARYGQY